MQKEIALSAYNWHETGIPLSTWVLNTIKDTHTKTFEFKGIAESITDLKDYYYNYYPNDQLPKVGDLWLVKPDKSQLKDEDDMYAENTYDEYICVSVDNGEYVWELVGNMTNVDLNNKFFTKAQSDERFASTINYIPNKREGVRVKGGNIELHMSDILDVEGYALSADVDALVDATEQNLNSEIQSKFNNVNERIERVKQELELYSDANDESLSALLRNRYEGRDSILSAAIDKIIQELEVELTYKGFTENVLIDSPVDPDWKIGDVKLVSSIFETTIDDVTTLTPSVDVYVWTGEPNQTNPDTRGWKLLGPIQGNRLSALFATKDYVNAKDEVAMTTLRAENAILSGNLQNNLNLASGNLQENLNLAVENLENTINDKITDISGAVIADYITFPYLNSTYDENIKSWVRNQISENVESLLKFKGIYNSFNEMKQALLETGSRVIGSVYLIPTTIDGTSYYEEYVIRKTEYADNDFELIGTVDINQMSKYLLTSEAAETYETKLNCDLIRTRLTKAETDIANISGELLEKLSTLSTNFENLNTRYNALEYTYSMLSSHIGRTTTYWSNLPMESLTDHLSVELSETAMNDTLNLYRFDQSFTIIGSDFTNLLQDKRYRLPPATSLPLGASVSYQVRNTSDEQKQLKVYINKENTTTPEVISITIPRNSEGTVLLCEFKVVFNGTENEWLLLKK